MVRMIELDATATRRQLALRWGVGAARSSSVEEVVVRSLALCASDPHALALSIWSRALFERITDVSDALAEATEKDRSLVGVSAMRRAIHLVHRSDMEMLLAVYSERFGPSAVRFAKSALVEAGLCDRESSEVRYTELCDKILSVLGDRELSLFDLATELPDIRARAMIAAGKPYQLEVDIGQCLLGAMGASGRLVCTQRAGVLAAECNWMQRTAWLTDEPALPELSIAKTRLVSRYLSVFGPAAHDDIVSWTGLTPGDVDAALRAIGGVEVAVEGWSGPRWVHADEIPHGEVPQPVGVALLPALDPVLMGYRDRSPWVAPEHLPSLSDPLGNIGPTIWLDGRVVGGWGLSRSGMVAVRLFEVFDSVRLKAIINEAARLESALAGRRVSPQIWTPLVRELWAS